MRITESQLRRIVREEASRILREVEEPEEVDYEFNPGALAKLVLADLGEKGVSDIFMGLSQGGPEEDRAYRRLVGVMNRLAGHSYGEGVEYLFDDVVGELEELVSPKSWTDTDAITDVLLDMGREIPPMDEADESNMEEVLDEIGARLDRVGAMWDWDAVAEVAEQENYHAVAWFAPRLRG